MDLNKAQVMGNVTQDIELKQTPNGQSVTSFSIATNRSWTDSSGNKQEQVEFHNIVLWGKLAEIAGQYVIKGQKIFLEGRIQTRNWEVTDGSKRYKTEIVGENLIMLGKGRENGQTPQTPQVPATQNYNQVPQGQVPQGQAPQGQAPQGQAPQGQAPQGQVPQGQNNYNQAPQGQNNYNQVPQGQNNYNQVPQGQTLGNEEISIEDIPF